MEQELTFSILDYFSLIKRKGVVSKAYMLIGDNRPVLDRVIRLLSCKEGILPCGDCWDCRQISRGNHPDFFTVQPQTTTIRIEDIREAQRFLFLKPYRLERKILLVTAADSFGPAAANAFLKTLEEPPKRSVIILSATKLEGIIPTIVSRCHKLFLPVPEIFGEPLAREVASFLNGQKVKFSSRKDFAGFLWGLIRVFYDELLFQVTGEKRLIKDSGCEIILRPYTAEELQKILRSIFKVFSVYQNINENLALNVIQAAL